MQIIKQSKYKEFNQKNDDAKLIFVNTIITFALKIFVLTFGLIRVFLINKFLGISNYGILNIMMAVTPFALIFISGSNDYSIFRILKNKNGNKTNLNKIMNEQIAEMHKSAILSLFFVVLLMIIAAFVFKSNNLETWMTVLFILSNSLDLLMFAFIVPYTQWYLNAKYKNYIFESWNILFATLVNLISFILISLFGIGVIHFNNTDYQLGALYILLCVNFLLSFRVFLSAFILNLMKRKYIPWFKREKTKNKLFKKKNQLYGYIFHLLLALLAVNIIPIILFIISSFIPNITTLSGIYFSYITFFAMFIILHSLILSIVPFLENKLKKNIKEINDLIFSINFLMIIFLIILYVGTIPFFSLIVNNYFNYYLILFLLISFSIFSLKSIDENIIYLDGKPQKYLWLTFFEIVIALISNLIGFLIIFNIKILTKNCLNILYCLVISDLFARLFKYFANIYYLSKIVYKCKFYFLLKNKIVYYLIYIFTFIFIIIFMTSKFSHNVEMKYTSPLPEIFSNNFDLKNYINDDLKNVNWCSVILITLIIDVGYLFTISYLVYIFDKRFKNIFNKLLFKTNLKTY